MNRTSPLLLIAVLCTSFLLTAGCGSDYDSVTGKLTFNGTPAPEGVRIDFLPQVEDGSPSFGFTDADGNYEMYFNASTKGVMPGKNMVRVSCPEVYGESGAPVRKPEHKDLVIPPEFNEETTLECDVDGSTVFDIDIQS